MTQAWLFSRQVIAAQDKGFLATPCGSFTALPALRYTCSKGNYIPSQVCLVLQAL